MKSIFRAACWVHYEARTNANEVGYLRVAACVSLAMLALLLLDPRAFVEELKSPMPEDA